MNTPEFIQLYGYETHDFENFVDLIFEDNKVMTRYYLKKNNVDLATINQMIYILTINFGFIIDKDLKDRLELIDFKTGSMRFYIWRNGLVEFHTKQ
jgi:hypothetical protein